LSRRLLSLTGCRPVSEAPDYIDPVEGWRLWLAVTDDSGALRLTSVMQPVSWPVREPIVAACVPRRSLVRTRRIDHPDRPAPVASCRCGIYAISDPRPLDAYFDTNHVRRCGLQWAIGRVSLWGTIVESQRGWRASHAYPKHLFVPLAKHNRNQGEEIGDHLSRYGVPVEMLATTITPRLLKELSAAEAPAA
jgi:hypothetical protein